LRVIGGLMMIIVMILVAFDSYAQLVIKGDNLLYMVVAWLGKFVRKELKSVSLMYLDPLCK
jgi:hypothetical protein